MSETRENDSQEKPIPNNSKPIADMVCEDLQKRKEFGTRKYGTPLQAFNGRKAVKDAYEELLDLAQYLRQMMEESPGYSYVESGPSSTHARFSAEQAATDHTTIDGYADFTDQTAIYPESGTGSIMELCYIVLGLVSEAGEVAGKLKKILRDGDTKEKRQALIDEIGDVYWYVARLSKAFQISPTRILLSNMAKLISRKERGVLKGDGDKR